MRGGEKVVEALCDMYPDADIFTLVYDESRVSEKIRKIETRQDAGVDALSIHIKRERDRSGHLPAPLLKVDRPRRLATPRINKTRARCRRMAGDAC